MIQGILIFPSTVKLWFEIALLKKDQGNIRSITKECEHLLTEQSDITMAKKNLARLCSILTSLEQCENDGLRQAILGITMKKAFKLGDFVQFGQSTNCLNFKRNHRLG